MKKLMIAAAIVCAAAFAQAGAVAWSAANIQAATGDVFEKNVTTYTAYLFLGTDSSAATKYLSGEGYDLAAFKDASVQNKSGTYNGTALSITGATYGSYGEGDTVSAYLVIVNADSVDNADYYQVAKVGLGGSGTSGEEVITKTFTKAGNQQFGWGNQINYTTWSKIESVPEPTSGLLLLLGVAGLALRRRRA